MKILIKFWGQYNETIRIIETNEIETTEDDLIINETRIPLKPIDSVGGIKQICLITESGHIHILIDRDMC